MPHSGSWKRLSPRSGLTASSTLVAGADALDGVGPDVHVAGKQPRLRLERARRVGQPVFGELGEGLDHVGDRLGDAVAHLALLARLGPGGRRLAGLLDHARQVEREALRILDEILLDVEALRQRRLCPARVPWPW